MTAVDVRLQYRNHMGSLVRRVSEAQLGATDFAVLSYLEGNSRRGGRSYCMGDVHGGEAALRLTVA